MFNAVPCFSGPKSINCVCVFLTCILRSDNYFSFIAVFKDCFSLRQNVKKKKGIKILSDSN